MKATAYAIDGVTKSGEPTVDGVTVAADPRVLPLGTRIYVNAPDGLAGEYVVTDTGRKVKGRHIDIYVPSVYEAKQFGRHIVTVHVLEYPGEEKQVAQAQSAE